LTFIALIISFKEHGNTLEKLSSSKSLDVAELNDGSYVQLFIRRTNAAGYIIENMR